MPESKYVVAYGNPADGFRLVGPFDNHDDAVAYIESEPSSHDNMWVMEIDHPEK